MSFLPRQAPVSTASSSESLPIYMGKRKLVPAALHKELSEYTSLLRALQTNDTLDLASQLTKPRPKASTSQQSTPGFDLDDGRDQPVPSTVASRDITPSALSTKSRTSLKRSSSGKVVKEKDNWTRWPLLVEDIHAPEFSFQDEVKMLALHTLKKQEPIDSMDGPSEEQDEDAILPQPFLEAMTFECSTHLSRILSALAAHIPPVEKSMQNRIKPMNWEGVLDIVAVSGLVDSKFVFDPCSYVLNCLIILASCNRIVQDVQRRMELLYGPAANNCQ